MTLTAQPGQHGAKETPQCPRAQQRIYCQGAGYIYRESVLGSFLKAAAPDRLVGNDTSNGHNLASSRRQNLLWQGGGRRAGSATTPAARAFAMDV